VYLAGSRYRKPQKDLSTLDPNSQEYWEEILKREGLAMTRGLYPQRNSYGWDYHDTDPRNDQSNTPSTVVPQPLARASPECPLGEEHGPETGPQSKPLSDNYGVAEDNYTEDSKP
jgi:hypothetical protein